MRTSAALSFNARAVRVLAASAGVAAVWLAHASAARAESCAYDAATKAVLAEITPGGSATLTVVGGELWFGFSPAPCAGATTTNTNSISVAGAAGMIERLVLDHAGGAFAPGAAAESNLPEIEIAADLGDRGDGLVVLGTDAADRLVAGQGGIALNTDGDADVTVAPAALEFEVHGLGGDDTLGTRGFGAEYLGAGWAHGGEGADTLSGGAGNDTFTGGPGDDVLDGGSGDDVLDGGEGSDTLKGGTGNDDLTGGPGADTLTAADGDDLIRAEDGVADLGINGGPGADTAWYDQGLDPSPVAVETKLATPPPPAPAGSCTYAEATKSVSVQLMPGGEQQRIRVVGSTIQYGAATLAPCGVAATTNTDKITVVGTTGYDNFVIDEGGGWFVPGATPETDVTSEIEIAANLGEATDDLTVIGADRNDTISIGQSGIALNADGDNDVTWSPRPARLSVYGMGGRNNIAGRGGAGSGTPFSGQLFLYAGDVGDTLRGSSAGDVLVGGAGNDLLDGREAVDFLDGRGGNDTLTGADGGDTLTGGPGADSFSGGDGADTLYANDGEADVSINGGPLIDTAYYDGGLDPEPIAVEHRNP